MLLSASIVEYILASYWKFCFRYAQRGMDFLSQVTERRVRIKVCKISTEVTVEEKKVAKRYVEIKARVRSSK